MVKHLNIKIFGLVQMVLFRYSALEKAKELGVKGFVKNEDEGKVYIEVEGEEDALDKFVEWCNKGPRLAKVEKVEKTKGEMKNFLEFKIEN